MSDRITAKVVDGVCKLKIDFDFDGGLAVMAFATRATLNRMANSGDLSRDLVDKITHDAIDCAYDAIVAAMGETP